MKTTLWVLAGVALAGVGLLGCHGGGAPLSGDKWVTKFTNNEGAGVVNDLHVVWDRAVVVGQTTTPNGPYLPATVSPDGKTTDFSGAEVAEGRSAFITLNVAWEGDDYPHVEKWWWTDAGVKVGNEHTGNP